MRRAKPFQDSTRQKRLTRKVWQVGAFLFTSMARIPNSSTWIVAPDAYLRKGEGEKKEDKIAL